MANIIYPNNDQNEIFSIVSQISFEKIIGVITNKANDISVKFLTPGKSGALVLLVRSIGLNKQHPLVLKIAADPALIITESDNYDNYISNFLPHAPERIDTGSHNALAYKFAGVNFEDPNTFRNAFSKMKVEPLKKLILKIIKTLFDWSIIKNVSISNTEEMKLKPLFAEQIKKLGPDFEKYKDLPKRWQALKDLRSKKSVEKNFICHGDLNAGNVMLDIESEDPVPLFIDFGSVGKRIAFWDYAKFERDLKLRCYFGGSHDDFTRAAQIIRCVDSGDQLIPTSELNESENKLLTLIDTLRHYVVHFYGKYLFDNSYFDSLLYSTIQVLYRAEKDVEGDLVIQKRLACESISALISYLEKKTKNRTNPDEVIELTKSKGSNEKPSEDLSGLLCGPVLCGRILEFPTLDAAEQKIISGVVSNVLDNFLLSSNPYHYLDFKGGDFLLFLKKGPEDEHDEELLLKVFFLALRMQLVTSIENLKLSISMNWENQARSFNIIHSYPVGPSFYESCQAVSFADKAHFFIFEKAYKILKSACRENGYDTKERGSTLQEVLNGNKALKEIVQDICGSQIIFNCQEVSFYDRFKVKYDTYSLYGTNSESRVVIGCNTIPYNRIAIEYRDEQRNSTIDPKQTYVRRLAESEEVVIIGVTHEGTAKYLEEALKSRIQKNKEFWHCIKVIFPSQSILEKRYEGKRDKDDSRINRWWGGKNSVFAFLLGQGSRYYNNWKCLEYNGNLPFVGSMLNNSKESLVRVGPILPGVAIRQTYYMEFFKEMSAYPQLSTAFKVILANSTCIHEWNLYGKVDFGVFKYIGLFNRKRIMRKKEQGVAFPVVLVLLHTIQDGVPKAVLQERTLFNASEDRNLISNISGRLTDFDVFLAEGKVPPHEYLENYNKAGINVRDDAATSSFNNHVGITIDKNIHEKIFKHAAIREMHEELGLEIVSTRLKKLRSFHFFKDDRNLFFQIFSLELKRDRDDEVDRIESLRPYVNLHFFSLKKLKEYHNAKKFNHFLQSEFDNIFWDIYSNVLNIADE